MVQEINEFFMKSSIAWALEDEVKLNKWVDEKRPFLGKEEHEQSPMESNEDSC